MLKFHIYQDVKGEWRWRLKAKNGRTVADSGEGYKTHAKVVNAIRLVAKSALRFNDRSTVLERPATTAFIVIDA